MMFIGPSKTGVALEVGVVTDDEGTAVIHAMVAREIGTELWMLEWCRWHWNHGGLASRVLGRASYAAYVVHPPIVVVFAIALRAAPLPVEVKFLVVAAAGVAAAFTVGWLATRSRMLARVL